ncbi:MAG TPA: protein kinase [Candidatus Paceibacterota bacterium]|nr:protein kinase [Candidatus Paceibacterota bacterium]
MFTLDDKGFPAGYELLCRIGAGGYGEVWLGRHFSGECRAIKVIRRAAFLEERPFLREMAGVRKFQALAATHPSLIKVLDLGEADDGSSFYYIMELADNASGAEATSSAGYAPRTLELELSRTKPLSPESCTELGIGLASALESLHAQGLIHRDIKPGNILFVGGTPKLGDIGLVIEASEAKSFGGTEGYIPPEGPGTIQADLYSLGMVLFEAATGLSRHEYGDRSLWPKVRCETLAGLLQIVRKACAERVRHRYHSAGEMIADLRRVQRGQRVGSSRWWPASARARAGVVAGLLALGTVMAWAAIVWTGKMRTAPLPALPAPPGLVAWWRGEGNAQDAAGTNHGVLVGQVGFAPGMVGLAFRFNGTNGYVRIPKNPSLTFSNQVTFELWFQDQSPVPYYAGLVSDRGRAEGKIQPTVALAPEGIALYFNDPLVDDRIHSTAFEVSYSPRPVQARAWIHLAAVFEQCSAGEVELRTFVNGKRTVTARRRGSLANTINDNPFILGAQSEPPILFFEGLIDEVSVYNRALTDQEITAVFSAGRAGKKLPAPPHG